MADVNTNDRFSVAADIQFLSTGNFLYSIPLKYRTLPDLELRDRPTRLRIGAFSTSSALQAAGRRRIIQCVRCSAALNEQQIAPIDPMREKRRE